MTNDDLTKAAALLLGAGFAVIPLEEHDRLVALDAATTEYLARVVASMRAGRKPSEMSPYLPDEIGELASQARGVAKARRR